MPVVRRSIVLGLGLVLLAAACGKKGADATGSAHTLTQAGWDSLPVLAVTDGARLCLADGTTDCPLAMAYGNWLDDQRLVLWESARRLLLWRSGDTTAVPMGSTGIEQGQYISVLAAGPGSGDHVELVTATESGLTLMEFDAKGTFVKSGPLPAAAARTARGFAGPVPILQRIAQTSDSGTAEMQIELLRTIGDSAGTVAFTAPLPWLRIRGEETVSAPSFFPAPPVFAVAADRDVLSSPGGTLEVRRAAADGTVRWTLTSPLTGAPITDADIAARKTELAGATLDTMSTADAAAMRARTGTHHPAVAGLLLARDGRVLVAGPSLPLSETTEHLRLKADGTPDGRVALPRGTFPILFAGDSLLVHRRADGELREIRWLRLGPGR